MKDSEAQDVRNSCHLGSKLAETSVWSPQRDFLLVEHGYIGMMVSSRLLMHNLFSADILR